jgi:hypothetical protein
MRALILLPLLACGKPPEPKLSVIQRELFTPSCTFSACHGSIAPEAGLDLRAGHAYSSLMMGTRVVPGNPDASYLIDKVYGRKNAAIMPPPETGVMEEQWKHALSEWVARGAQDD